MGLSTPRGDDPVRVIAHRGFADDNPENTLPAFRRAAGRADAVEMDVRRCGSGEPVVIHDATLDRVTDDVGRVDETPLSALREVDVRGSGEGVPTLSEAVGAVPPEVAVVVELKAPVVDDVITLEVENDLLVSSFDADLLSRTADRGGPPTARIALPWDTAAIEEAASVGCAAVHPERTAVFLDPGYVDRAHRAGLAVNVWPVHDREDAVRLAARGVDGVAVDRADAAPDDEQS